jgi:hypothetical protein
LGVIEGSDIKRKCSRVATPIVALDVAGVVGEFALVDTGQEVEVLDCPTEIG